MLTHRHIQVLLADPLKFSGLRRKMIKTLVTPEAVMEGLFAIAERHMSEEGVVVDEVGFDAADWERVRAVVDYALRVKTKLGDGRAVGPLRLNADRAARLSNWEGATPMMRRDEVAEAYRVPVKSTSALQALLLDGYIDQLVESALINGWTDKHWMSTSPKDHPIPVEADLVGALDMMDVMVASFGDQGINFEAAARRAEAKKLAAVWNREAQTMGADEDDIRVIAQRVNSDITDAPERRPVEYLTPEMRAEIRARNSAERNADVESTQRIGASRTRQMAALVARRAAAKPAVLPEGVDARFAMMEIGDSVDAPTGQSKNESEVMNRFADLELD